MPHQISTAVSVAFQRLRSYSVGCFQIDTRTLAVFRILVGSLILADLLLRSRNFTFFYAEDGVVPRSLALQRTSDEVFSFYYVSTEPAVTAALFVVQALIALQLVVGYRTRIATILSFLFVVSLDFRNPFVLSYADTLFRLLLFWAIFLPLGERWSIDAIHANREPRSAVVNAATAMILLQMVYMYVVNWHHKRQSDLWTSGEATPLIMGLDNTTFLLGDLTREFPTLLQYGGLKWYYMLMFAWLLVLLRGRARMLFVALFLGGHATFAITVRIGAFPYVALAGLLLFLQAQFWDDLSTLGKRLGVSPSRLRPDPHDIERLGRLFPTIHWGIEADRVRAWLYNLILVVVVLSTVTLAVSPFAPMNDVVSEETEDRIDEVASVGGVSQPEWSVFAPHPRTTDRYYVFLAETEDGDRYDVYNDREFTYDRPHDELQKQYGTYRERFYMTSVQSSNVVASHLADHICAEWEEERQTNLTHINMYEVTERVTLETIDDPSERSREAERFYEHGCGDNPPAVLDEDEINLTGES